jgi:hypothetical protein
MEFPLPMDNPCMHTMVTKSQMAFCVQSPESQKDIEEEAQRLSSLVLQEWCPPPTSVCRKDCMRAEFSRRMRQLQGLRLADSTAEFFEPVLAKFGDVCSGLSGKSWADTFKPLSKQGYDVVCNRCVDYGNFQYRVVLLMWCACRPSIAASLYKAAQSFAALDCRLADSLTVFDRQGDVVEIMLALARGEKSFGLRSDEESDDTKMRWRIMYGELCDFSRSVDFLYSTIFRKSKKIAPWEPPPVAMQVAGVQEFAYSTYAFSRLALHLVTRL